MQRLYDYPDIYDAMHANVTEDIGVYLALARQTGGPVLEVGCGSGRVSAALVRQGFTVYGLDSSEALLSRARERLCPAHADDSTSQGRFIPLLRDVLDVPDTLSVSLALLPLNFCAHVHTPDALHGVFAAVKRVLSPGGQVVVHGFSSGSGVAGDGVFVYRGGLRLEAGESADWYETRRVNGVFEHLTWFVQTPDADYTFPLTLRLWKRSDYLSAAVASGLTCAGDLSLNADENLLLHFVSPDTATDRLP